VKNGTAAEKLEIIVLQKLKKVYIFKPYNKALKPAQPNIPSLQSK